MDIINNMIDEITSNLITMAPDYIIFGGELNTDLRIISDVSEVIHAFAGDHDLIECSGRATPPIDFTYHNFPTGHRSFIDWLLVSSSLRLSVTNLDIIDQACNQSDHLPVVLESLSPFNLELNETTAHKSSVNISHTLCWKKVNFEKYVIFLSSIYKLYSKPMYERSI